LRLVFGCSHHFEVFAVGTLFKGPVFAGINACSLRGKYQVRVGFLQFFKSCLLEHHLRFLSLLALLFFLITTFPTPDSSSDFLIATTTQLKSFMTVDLMPLIVFSDHAGKFFPFL